MASGKNHIKGPKKRTPEDDEHFSESFERMIRMAIQNREGENNGKECLSTLIEFLKATSCTSISRQYNKYIEAVSKNEKYSIFESG